MASPRRTRRTASLPHVRRPISPARTAQHALGWALDVDARLAEHARAGGARPAQVALERSIGWDLVRTWPGETRRDERRHTTGAHGARLCPRGRGRGGDRRGGKPRA
jgi:hypothetical protein